jgi:hypothetical protein
MTKRTDYREYTTVDVNGHPVMIKTGPAKKGVPWEPVDLPGLPIELQKSVVDLDRLYARCLAADAAENEDEAQRLWDEYQGKLKTFLDGCREVLPAKPGKELSLKYAPRRLDYYYRDQEQAKGQRPRKRKVLITTKGSPLNASMGRLNELREASRATAASGGNDTETSDAAE